MMVEWDFNGILWDIPSGYDSHSHGKSTIDSGFSGTIIYKWVIFHGELLNNQMVSLPNTKPAGVYCSLIPWSLKQCYKQRQKYSFV